MLKYIIVLSCILMPESLYAFSHIRRLTYIRFMLKYIIALAYILMPESLYKFSHVRR